MKLLNTRAFKSMCLILLMVSGIFSCDEDESYGPKGLIANLSYEVNADDWHTIEFTNRSKESKSVSWDFGDGNTSVEENPMHVYDSAGEYDVTITAVKGEKTDTKTRTVTVKDPNEAYKELTGETSKTWKMVREGIGITQYDTEGNFQWSFGDGGSTPFSDRPCIMNDEYIFHFDGTYEYQANGDFWGELNIFNETCLDETVENYVNNDGVDVSDWMSNDGHSFEYDMDNATIILKGTGNTSGKGAFIVNPRIASNETTVPIESRVYNVEKLVVDGPVDTLVLGVTMSDEAIVLQYTLVSYDDPSDEPDLGESAPTASYTYAVNDKNVTFTNGSSSATSYSWDFGDGSSSTESSPSHTYSSNGLYVVTLTATNDNGSTESAQTIIVGASAVTLSDLTSSSNKTWKLYNGDGAIRVGASAGSGEWYSISAADIQARSCMLDDEFIFYADNSYEYDSKGQMFGEDYMGVDPAGCTDEDDLSEVYKGLGSNDGYSFSFTAATNDDPAYITVNGEGAFLGFAKGYNGGEYSGSDESLKTSVSYEVLYFINGGSKQYLSVGVDISANQDGTSYWSVTLVSE